MSNVKFKNRKTFQLAIVLVLVIGIILAGTFAWVNFTQSALNVFEGWTNPDVNLHDDYDPGSPNKDVYVENSGQRPLYVRVRFDEFMEINGDTVISGDTKGDLSTWHAHSYLGTSPASCGEEFHDYYDWILGTSTGTSDPDKGFKYYIPAPIENRALFAANGDELRQPTVVKYLNDSGAAVPLYGTVGTDKNAYTSSLKSLKDTYDIINAILAGAGTSGTIKGDLDALYATLDAAPDKATRATAQAAITAFLTTHKLGYYDLVYDVGAASTTGNIIKQNETVKFVPIERTSTSKTVYTMAQWIANGTPTGNFWIMDNDGWCYWGNVLLPKQATGLLLSEVALGANPPAGVWYYGINAKLEAVTVDDLTKFETTGNNSITDQGTMVLMAVSGNYVFDMEKTKTGPNDPVYTFVNNEDNTYRQMITSGASVTYGPLFAYTGSVPPLTKGDIYASQEYKATVTATTFKKDIPFGKQGETFKVVETTTGSGTGVLEGADGKHYIKLAYDTGFTKTAWLAVGADGKFDKLAAGVSSGDDVLVWVNTGEVPGTGNGRYQEADNSNNVKVNDAFTLDSVKWVVIGKDTKAGSPTIGKTLIVSDAVVDANIASSGVTAKLATHDAAALPQLHAIDTGLTTPTVLTIQQAMDYFASNSDRVANDTQATPKPSKWWVDAGAGSYSIVDINGAILPFNATRDTSVGVRIAFWIDTAKLQAKVDATPTMLTH